MFGNFHILNFSLKNFHGVSILKFAFPTQPKTNFQKLNADQASDCRNLTAIAFFVFEFKYLFFD